ncbi:AraC family transcriptional regulator [Marinilabiliaceae bacterium JC017]|nr:AraC family transcriptional regulator [Marinilabiliaceae bacterium JC017]
MEINFTVNKPHNWLENVADQFGVAIQNNTIYLPKNLGDGFLRHYYLTNEFVLTYLRFKLKHPLTFIRNAGEVTHLSPITFYIHKKKFQQVVAHETREISAKSPNGIFWPSAQMGTKWEFPLNEWVSNITIVTNHQFILNSLKETKVNYVHQLLNSTKPFYISEEMTQEMLDISDEIINVIDHGHHPAVSNLFIESKVIQLLAIFLEKIIERPLNKSTSDLKTDDVDKLFRTKSVILNDLSKVPPIKDLAATVGISESKLQKLFKQVFGKSIYQYSLYEKMRLAKKMLQSKKYSISEIGYQLGYSNLSHFSKAFRNQFGVNPRDCTSI